MVGLFVERLMYYKDWVWTTSDSTPQLGIGGLITPLLIANGVNLGNDAKGPSFIDAPYLRIATYIGGRYHENFVYTYYHNRKMVELLLPNRELTSIAQPGIIHFNIAEAEFFGSHGPIDHMTAPRRKRGGVRAGVRYGTTQFMKKVADLLVKGGVGGCSSEDFVTRDTSVPQPQPFNLVMNPSLALGPPLTARQLLRLARNPEAPKSNSGNKSSSLASTDDETDNEESLSGVGVSIGVLTGTWKHLGSKKEWKVLFELVEHRIGQQERPTTPSPDETKAARHPAAGLAPALNQHHRGEVPAPNSTSRRQLSRVGATKGSEVRNPRAIRKRSRHLERHPGVRWRSRSESRATWGSDFMNPRACLFF
ncbi:hypothetical protein F2Q69_00036853 [Brassica cretica]|uniref:Arabidopsis retrotransposon Orf1 C-terminal domain-containing protein n=1 Tax=Brassica cretica TaxID=69181 RepID=A0A8S9SIH0_BRACR|nr:hypothetical protein F2Q69_00036853 [Brassica cretica]